MQPCIDLAKSLSSYLEGICVFVFFEDAYAFLSWGVEVNEHTVSIKSMNLNRLNLDHSLKLSDCKRGEFEVGKEFEVGGRVYF